MSLRGNIKTKDVYAMTQRIAICGADGDKRMFVPKYAHSREDMHVYHTFDCLLGDDVVHVGDETPLGRISHFYIVDDNLCEDDVLTECLMRMYVYAAIRIPPMCCSDNEKRHELIRKTENLLTQSGYHCECCQRTRDCIEKAISVLIDSSCTYLNCIAIPAGYVELNLSELQSEPLLNETGYRVAKEVRRRWRRHSTVHVDTGISRIRTKKAGKLIANPSIKRGCVIKLPSVLKNMMLNVISAYDDVLVVAGIPYQDGISVEVDDNEFLGNISFRGNNIAVDGKKYGMTKKRIDVIAEPTSGYTTVRFICAYNRYDEIHEAADASNSYRYHVPVIDEYEISGIEIGDDAYRDYLKEYTFRVRNSDINVVRYVDAEPKCVATLDRSPLYRIAKTFDLQSG